MERRPLSMGALSRSPIHPWLSSQVMARCRRSMWTEWELTHSSLSSSSTHGRCCDISHRIIDVNHPCNHFKSSTHMVEVVISVFAWFRFWIYRALTNMILFILIIFEKSFLHCQKIVFTSCGAIVYHFSLFPFSFQSEPLPWPVWYFDRHGGDWCCRCCPGLCLASWKVPLVFSIK